MREALTVVGFAVGSYFGPLGAQIGAAIGGAIGGYLDPIKIPAPGLGEAPVQTGRDGIPIPIGWGIVHLAGNIIQQNPLVIVRTWERQGKGGSTKVEKISQYKTFAIGLCRSSEGPIAAILRIWENDKLVYDASGAGLPLADSTKFAEGIRVYYGDEQQLPDPDLEAHVGVGNCPAYRGLPYVVFVNKDVTNFGGAIPSYRFEIDTGTDYTVTSKPYPIDVLDGFQVTQSIPVKGRLMGSVQEGLAIASLPLGGTIREPLLAYSYEEEGLAIATVPLNGTIKVSLLSYTAEEEGLAITTVPLNGTIRVAIVFYDDDPEGLAITSTPLNGTLI